MPSKQGILVALIVAIVLMGGFYYSYSYAVREASRVQVARAWAMDFNLAAGSAHFTLLLQVGNPSAEIHTVRGIEYTLYYGGYPIYTYRYMGLNLTVPPGVLREMYFHVDIPLTTLYQYAPYVRSEYGAYVVGKLYVDVKLFGRTIGYAKPEFAVRVEGLDKLSEVLKKVAHGQSLLFHKAFLDARRGYMELEVENIMDKPVEITRILIAGIGVTLYNNPEKPIVIPPHTQTRIVLPLGSAAAFIYHRTYYWLIISTKDGMVYKVPAIGLREP